MRRSPLCRPRTWAVATAVVCALTAGGSVAAGEPSSTSTPTPSEVPDRHGSVYLDPLGFLLFGPTLGLEAGAGHVTGLVDARWFNMGVLAHSLFLNQGDSFDFSWGVGAGGRYYFWPGMAGPYVGARFEYIATRIEN